MDLVIEYFITNTKEAFLKDLNLFLNKELTFLIKTAFILTIF